MTALPLVVAAGVFGLLALSGGKKGRRAAPSAEPDYHEEGMAALEAAAAQCVDKHDQILAAGDQFAKNLEHDAKAAYDQLATTLGELCPEAAIPGITIEDHGPPPAEPPPTRGYLLPCPPDMSGLPSSAMQSGGGWDLCSAYQACMNGTCSLDEARALADELDAAGFPDHAADIRALIADMTAEAAPPVQPGYDYVSFDPTEVAARYGVPATPTGLATAIKDQAASIGCENLPTDLVSSFQALAKNDGKDVDMSGLYDFVTAVAAAMYVAEPPPPCRFPPPPGPDPAEVEKNAEDWLTVFQQIGQHQPPAAWPELG